MNINLRKDSRKLHRWGALLIALPFLIVLLSGIYLFFSPALPGKETANSCSSAKENAEIGNP